MLVSAGGTAEQSVQGFSSAIWISEQLLFKIRASGTVGEIFLPKALSQELNAFRCLPPMKFYFVLVVKKKGAGVLLL